MSHGKNEDKHMTPRLKAAGSLYIILGHSLHVHSAFSGDYLITKTHSEAMWVLRSTKGKGFPHRPAVAERGILPDVLGHSPYTLCY